MKKNQIKLFADEGVFEGHVLHGKLIDTHISWVVLSGGYAFKIKKPLKYSFLDFSTLALRKKYCERELKLNRRYSNIYISALPIRLNHGVYTLGGSRGRIVDFAVVMKRMKASLQLNYRLRKKTVVSGQIKTLAKVIAAVHARANICRKHFSTKTWSNLFNDIQTCKKFIMRKSGRRYGDIIKHSIEWSDSFLAAYPRHFQERIDNGFWRDVHGDLHSGNIFMGKHPILFDCIEFNDAYRKIDVLYEMAFLVMDFEAMGHQKLSRVLLKTYIQQFPCLRTEDDMRMFRYYKGLRANIRAKVHMINAQQSKSGTALRSHLLMAKKYLSLLDHYINDYKNLVD